MPEQPAEPDLSSLVERNSLTTAVWLSRIGMARYAVNFQAHSTVADLACVLYPNGTDAAATDEAELQLRRRYGVTALGARRKLLSSLREWAPSVMFRERTPERKQASNALFPTSSNGQRLFRTLSGAAPKVPPPKKRPPIQKAPARERTPERGQGSNSLFKKALGGQRLFRTLSGAAPRTVPSKKRPLLQKSLLSTKRARSQLPKPDTNTADTKIADSNTGDVETANAETADAETAEVEVVEAETADTKDGDKPEKKRNVWPIFHPGYRPPPPRPKKSRSESNLLTTTKSGQFVFRAPSSSKSDSDATGGRSNERERSSGWGSTRRYHLHCHRVPGTKFVVDSFRVSAEHDDASVRFLSHMHSDHYGGLTKKSLREGAQVWCSPTTGALAQKILGLKENQLRILPLGESVDITCSSTGARVTVWVYDANHCPGAVVILFRMWSTGEYVLHSGDCRFDVQHFSIHSELADAVSRSAISTLYLDTTYAGESHAFPRQAAVLDAVADAVRVENDRTSGKAVFFVGSYTIGKERVVLAVARALGTGVRIFAESRKRGIFRASDLGADFESRLTDKANQARVCVVPMGGLNPDGVREFVRRNKMDGSKLIGRGLVVCVRPTGWSYKAGGPPVRKICRGTDNAVVLQVAYSEHSSLSELREFVHWAKPKRIVPTVGFQDAEKQRRLFSLLGHKQAR